MMLRTPFISSCAYNDTCQFYQQPHATIYRFASCSKSSKDRKNLFLEKKCKSWCNWISGCFFRKICYADFVYRCVPTLSLSVGVLTCMHACVCECVHANVHAHACLIPFANSFIVSQLTFWKIANTDSNICVKGTSTFHFYSCWTWLLFWFLKVNFWHLYLICEYLVNDETGKIVKTLLLINNRNNYMLFH